MTLTAKKFFTPFRIIIFGFLGVILLGALLLMLPFSAASGDPASFSDALFTATSATCVTGLVVRDTATYWSGFGQGIILILIQTGGMGVVTIAVLIAMLSGKKIGLGSRGLMQESVAAHNLGGILRLTGFIVKLTLIFELVGALFLSPVFCREFGIWKGLWYSVFHSVSAFCNAGFDLMGVKEAFSSLTSYSGNIYMNIVIMLLIVFGGLGFLTWDDLRTHKFKIKKYRMQTKIILTVTIVLIFLPAAYFYFFEFAQEPLKDRVLFSLFQSVTARTAGFNTASLSAMSGGGTLIMIILMLIGGSPGSTAGGMKTTTAAVLFLNCIAVFKRKEHPGCFGRRFDPQAVRSSSAIFLLYLAGFLGGALFIANFENLSLSSVLFETASAIGTVGVTQGITTTVSPASRAVLMVLMYIGRVGGLTLIYAAVSGAKPGLSMNPQEKITVG